MIVVEIGVFAVAHPFLCKKDSTLLPAKALGKMTTPSAFTLISSAIRTVTDYLYFVLG